MIYEVRGFKVMLDSDLAALYEVETKNLNRALQEKINKTPIKYIKRARDVFELCKNAREWYLQANNEKREKY